MDRYLISGTIGLLIIQVLFLLNSLGLVDLYHFQNLQDYQHREKIGVLLQKRQDVKRKSADSIIWQDSYESDQLYRYDSVLTLEDSKAELKLDGDINLKIYENTLVVLDPLEDANDSLRVRFYRGLLQSRNGRKKFTVGSGEWSIEATTGTSMSLKSIGEEKLEVEVSKGEIFLGNNLTGAKEIIENSKLILNKDKIEEKQEITESVKFDENLPQRIYSHIFPIALPVQWQGQVSKLRVLHPAGHEEYVDANSGLALLSMTSGTYRLSLIDGLGKSSKTQNIEIIPSPKIRYIHPLPRDRVEFGHTEMFSWYPIDNIKKYELRLLSENHKINYKTNLPYTSVKADNVNDYTWSVFAYDEEGFEIPPYYSLPIYFIEKPLAAPVLNAPTSLDLPSEQRLPASDPDQSFLMDKVLLPVLDWLLPAAHAERLAGIVFTWQHVEGADQYILEISSSADFLKPEVISNVGNTKFIWSDYKNKVYYWRVAAGTKSGRMGLFSEPAEFDVNKLNFDSSQKGQPYFEKIKKEIPVVSKPAIEEVDALDLEADKLEDEQQMAEAGYIGPAEFSFGFDYTLMNQENGDIGKANFQGFVLPVARFYKSWTKNFSTEINHSYFVWQPRDLDAYPYQPEFITQITTIKASYKYLNLMYTVFPIIERQALEAVDANEVGLIGFYIPWDLLENDKRLLKAEVSFSYGDDIYMPTAKATYRFKTWGKSYLETNFELGYFTDNEDINGNWIKSGLHWGFRW